MVEMCMETSNKQQTNSSYQPAESRGGEPIQNTQRANNILYVELNVSYMGLIELPRYKHFVHRSNVKRGETIYTIIIHL